MNALSSINDLFNAKVIDVSCFAYSPYYNEVNVCVRSQSAVVLMTDADSGPKRGVFPLPQADAGLHLIGGTHSHPRRGIYSVCLFPQV